MMPRALIALCCLVLSLALAACGWFGDEPETDASDPAAAAPSQPATEAEDGAVVPPAVARVEEACPVQVPATSVTVVNTKSGVALYFTTTNANVGEVRRRVGALATASSTPPGAPVPHRETRRGTDVPYWDNAVRPELVPLHATAEEISGGARLVLIPVDPLDLEPLRAYARSHGDRMRLGSCAPDFLKQRMTASAGPSSAGATSRSGTGTGV